MSSILVNLAMVLGFVICIVTLVVGLLAQVPFWTIIFRAAIAMSIGTVIIMGFFRYFNIVLYKFLNEKLEEHRRQMDAEGSGDEVVEE